jgi:flagellar protein FlaG
MVSDIQVISTIDAARTVKKDGNQETTTSSLSKTSDTKGMLEQTQSIVNGLNKNMENSQTNIAFSIDDSTKSIVVKVVDQKTNKVIRQIPAEEMIKLSQKIADLMGVLCDRSL